MKRELITPRPNAYALVKQQGMLHAGTEDKPYWKESVCYHFSEQQILEVERVTAELHYMCMNAVDHVIKNDLFDRLHIPRQLVPYIRQSRAQNDPFVYGRFDLVYGGVLSPKMLEYNADTPTSLVEASLIQHLWWKEKRDAGELPANCNQFNSIYESLTRAWGRVREEITQRHGSFPRTIHFTCHTESAEDLQTINHMADAAYEAGIGTDVIDINKIGTDGTHFYDERNRRIAAMFKLYPWEWLMNEPFGPQILHNRTGFIEPAWKMILSNKGLMAILWEMYPGHPNLLPTYDVPGKITGPYVKKPFISREGANVSLHGTGHDEASEGAYGAEGYIYQAYAPLPDFDGHYPIIGSWITSSAPQYPDMPVHPRGGEACGMGVREDTSRITNDGSTFVPHYFTPTM